METTKFYYSKWNRVGLPLGYAAYWLTITISDYIDYRHYKHSWSVKYYWSDLWFWNLVSGLIFLTFLTFFVFRHFLPGLRGKIGLIISPEKIVDPGHTQEVYWRDVVSIKKRKFSNYIHIETSEGALFKINIGQYTIKGPVIFKTFLNYFEKYGSFNAPGILLVS